MGDDDLSEPNISDKEFRDNGLDKEDMHKITQHIRVLSM
jgi:hypothetical protein